jgi:hypothetical protein
MGYPIYKLKTDGPDALIEGLRNAGLAVTEIQCSSPHEERVFEISQKRSRVRLSVLTERLAGNRLMSLAVCHRLFWFGDLKLLRRVEAFFREQGINPPTADELRVVVRDGSKTP